MCVLCVCVCGKCGIKVEAIEFCEFESANPYLAAIGNTIEPSTEALISNTTNSVSSAAYLYIIDIFAQRIKRSVRVSELGAVHDVKWLDSHRCIVG